MSDEKTVMTEAERGNLDVIAAHRDLYLETGGVEGHVRDFTFVGGHPFGPTLLIETFGRKSGNRNVYPLCYGFLGGEAIVVASKGGADVHPGWYHNLKAMDSLIMQIGTQAWRCTWREPEGEERKKVWDYICDVFPPYVAYQAGTDREIPIIMLKPGEAVDVLKP